MKDITLEDVLDSEYCKIPYELTYDDKSNK